MGDRTAFFYGTLMAPGVLHRVIYGTTSPEQWQRDLTTIRPALLDAYQRHRVRHADYPAIVPCTNASVRGAVVTGLTEGDLYRLDIFEGDQYERRKVGVRVLDVGPDQRADEEAQTGEMVQAETYVWIEGQASLESQEWDFDEFKREKMRAWMGQADYGEGEGADRPTRVADEGFADVDRAVAEQERLKREQGTAKHDPMGGRGLNGRIGKQLKNAAV